MKHSSKNDQVFAMASENRSISHNMPPLEPEVMLLQFHLALIVAWR